MSRKPAGFPAVGILAAGLLAGLMSAPGLLAKTDPVTGSALPAGLEMVPPDCPGFATIRVAELYRSPSTKELREKAAMALPDFREKFQKATGVSLGQIARVTFILSPSRMEPAVVVTTIKPFVKETVRQAILPRADEQQQAGKTIYARAEAHGFGHVLYFASDRVFVVAPTKKDIDPILKHKPGPNKEGPLSEILSLAGGQHQLVVGVNIAHPFFQKAAKRTKGGDGVLLALSSARNGLLTLVSDRATVGNLRLTFAEESAAKEAREAVKNGKQQLLKVLDEGKKEMNRERDSSRVDAFGKYVMQKGLAFLDQAKEGIQDATLKITSGKEVEVSLKTKTSAAEWVTVMGGWFFIGIQADPDVERPPPPNLPPPAAKTRPERPSY